MVYAHLRVTKRLRRGEAAMTDDLIFGSSSKIYGWEVKELSKNLSNVIETQYFSLKYIRVESRKWH